MKTIGPPKMRISSFADPKFTQLKGEFSVLLNPDNYVLNYEIEFANNQTPGSSGQELKFNKIKPQKLEFEFLFDRTGAIPESGADSNSGVEEDIEKLKEVTMGFDGDIHRTRYLVLSWGKLLFKCCLTHLGITYKLFRPDGVPLRAMAKASFEEYRETEQRLAKENKKSPDMTHMRTVKAGDKLPLMCHKIYGDAKYYLQVAEVNGLNNFRSLNEGEKIFFPPFEK